MAVADLKKPKANWIKTVRQYQRAEVRRSLAQILSSVGPFLLILVAMYYSLSISYLLTLALSVLASGFVMRIFIIQHDCGHGSFFKSKRLNSLTGIACSYITLTPYEYWRTNHAIHHAHNGDLNYRGTGDIYTLTLEEYRAKSRWGRLIYRIYRNPFFLFFIGGPLMFLVLYRTPIAYRHARTRQGKTSVIRNDIFIALTMLVCYFTIGLDSLLLIYLPIIVFSASVGVFMFYVQHQFEDAYWSKAPEWTYDEAALKGSSYFRLPKIFQWFTGNIGLHHIHHLSPLIPNYELQRCHDENPEFQDVPTLTIRDSLRIIFSQIAIWDEAQERLINFRQAHQRLKEIEAHA